MKYNGIIVVEGKTDVSLLSSFLEADIVTTNGSAISEETLNFLEEASKTREIVLLLDPDSPGKKIRDAIAQRIPNAKHAFIPKEKAIKHHKVGVAESDKDTILDALANLVPEKSSIPGSLTMNDLFELGITGSDTSASLRFKIGSKLHIGSTNAKTFIKRANALGIDRKSLEDLING